MKVYISADIEGITGATHVDETLRKKSDYKEFREQMTAEVAAACEACLEAGATEVWVQDAHDTGRNLNPTKLPREIRLIRGWSGHPFLMAQELDKSFHAMMMIGYHSRAGSGATPLAHTMTGAVVHIKFNDRYVSEFLMHAYAGALVGVPVVYVSGDEALCREVAEVNEAIGTNAVMRGVGASTVSIHPGLAVDRIRNGVKKALAADVRQCLLPMPKTFDVEVRYRSDSRAFRGSFYPGAELADPFTIRYRTDDYFEVLRMLHFVV